MISTYSVSEKLSKREHDISRLLDYIRHIEPEGFHGYEGHDVNYVLQLLMDHNKWEKLMKGGKGIKSPQSEKGDKKEKHNASGSNDYTGSHQTAGLHNSNNNPRIKRSLDKHEDYANGAEHSAINGDKNLHGYSLLFIARSKRSTATTTNSRTKGSANKRNNMQKQSTNGDTIMDMTPRDGSTLGVAPNGVSYNDKHNESRGGSFGCIECLRHHVYHKSGSDYYHHVEEEEHDTLHEVAHGLHFASVALLGFLVFEVYPIFKFNYSFY